MDSGPAPEGASRNDNLLRHAFSFPRHDLPELLHLVSLQKVRGRRECRALIAPAALRASKKARKQVTTGTPKRAGIPCAMVLRLIARSPRGAGLDSPRDLRER